MKRFSLSRVKYAFLPHKTSLLSLVIALLAALFFFLSDARSDLSTLLINIGLDIGRADFIAALLITATAALLGALLHQARSGAIMGASIAFGGGYLAKFVYTALKPVSDPTGNLEPLNRMALFSRSITIIALAILCAFIGAAVGSVLAQVVLGPPARLLRTLWGQKQHLENHEQAPAQPGSPVGDWLKALGVMALLVLSLGSSDLFLYAPDINLHTPAAQSAKGTIVTDRFESKTSKRTNEFQLYLPPSYYLSQSQTRRYPVLYLLHGSPGAAQDWFAAGQANASADTLIGMRSIAELILVLPDGNGRAGMTSEWGDSFDQKQRIETYVSKELVSYVDQHYRTLADNQHRAIGGLSMGGFGATNIAIHHPDVFASVISLGGYYRAEGAIWGPNTAYEQANSPLITVGQNTAAHKLHIYLGAATEDQPYYTDARQFSHTLDELHMIHAFNVVPGHHAWQVWQTQLYQALRWLPWNT
jgi:S-formylglutathione hydrolase FrmB